MVLYIFWMLDNLYKIPTNYIRLIHLWFAFNPQVVQAWSHFPGSNWLIDTWPKLCIWPLAYGMNWHEIPTQKEHPIQWWLVYSESSSNNLDIRAQRNLDRKVVLCMGIQEEWESRSPELESKINSFHFYFHLFSISIESF